MLGLIFGSTFASCNLTVRPLPMPSVSDVSNQCRTRRVKGPGDYIDIRVPKLLPPLDLSFTTTLTTRPKAGRTLSSTTRQVGQRGNLPLPHPPFLLRLPLLLSHHHRLHLL